MQALHGLHMHALQAVACGVMLASSNIMSRSDGIEFDILAESLGVTLSGLHRPQQQEARGNFL